MLIVLLACGEDENAVQSSGVEFFPLRKGFYQVYEVEDINYPRLGVTEESFYQLKTEVVDSFSNEQGGYTYTIHRSKRNTASDPWEFQQVWSVRMTTANVVVSEENIPFIKLVFPAVRNRQWDGNAMNTLPEDEYVLTNTGTSYQLETGTIPGDYLRVVQEDSGDAYNDNKQEEVYVRNIGLIYRERKVLEYCSTEGQCDITQRVIDNGKVYVQTLTEYGQN
jgi:hypothetical protein